MDKETLSHYGWIVIVTLILAVMLAFASPFGNFVANGVKAFTAGFVDTNNEALSDEYMQNIQDEWEEQLNDCEHEFIRLANEKTATCQSAGYTGDKVCNGCGKTMETGTVIAKLDHTPVTDNAVPATCEQEGKTEGSHCSSCNTVLVTQTTTDALGHDWGDPYVATEATCLGNGISRIDCQRDGCDAHTDTSIKAEGHTIVTVNGKAATCTATGLTNGEKCSVCGTVTSEQQVIPALGHTEVTDSAIQASCEVAGKTAGVHCSVCNTVIKAQETVPALGHNMGTPVTTLTATCTSEGQTKTSCTRTGCGYYEVDTIDALGHTEVTDKAVAATCTATGLEEGSHCTQCSYRVSQATTPALGHEYSDYYTVTEMTCTVDGVQRKDCKRDGCDHYETLTTTAPGHKEVADKAVAPTCTATGLTAGTHCSVCNKVLTAQTTVKALGHTEVTDKAVAATCTATGLTEGKHCSVCGEILTAQETIPALGHTEVIDKAVSATCLDTGLTEGKHCSVCNTVLVAQTTVEALGHDIVKDNAVTATCTATGLTTGEHCTRCDYKVAQTTTAALGHEYNSVTKEATCTEGGSTITTCSRCGDSSTTTTEALGHNYTAKVTTEATCTTKGVKTYTCSRCGDSYTESIPTTSHTDSNNDNICDNCITTIVIQNVPTAILYSDGTFVFQPTNEVDSSYGTIVSIYAGTYDSGDSNSGWATKQYSSSSPAPWNTQKSNIKQVIIEDGVSPKYTNYWFNGYTALKSATIGNSITTIGSSTFYGCTGLTSITIPDSVTSLGGSAFQGCTKLNSLYLGTGVKSMGTNCFWKCSALKNVYIKDLKAWLNISMGSSGQYPFSSSKGNIYLNGTLLTDVVIPSGISKINDFAFAKCTSITSIKIPSSVRSIGYNAFNNCTNLESITIDSGITQIYNDAFNYCSKLTSVTIPNSVTTIGDRVFLGCTNLEEITLGTALNKIGYNVFYSCSNLDSIIFKDTSTWYQTSSSEYIDGTEVDVSDATEAATLLKNGGLGIYWYKQ